MEHLPSSLAGTGQQEGVSAKPRRKRGARASAICEAARLGACAAVQRDYGRCATSGKLMTRSLSLTALAFVATLSITAGCTLSTPKTAVEVTRAAEVITRWDHRPEAQRWTDAKFVALETDGRALLETVPQDIVTFCPGYESADPEGRKAFWTALFSGLAGYESTWRPEAAGAGGRYRGLLQIWPTSARFYGCDLSHPKGLYDGPTNLRCAARIAAQAVERDRVVVGSPGNWGGVAKDWPPLRNARKRADIAEFTRALPVCQL